MTDLTIPSSDKLASNPKAYFKFVRELAAATHDAFVEREKELLQGTTLRSETLTARTTRALDEKEWVREFDYPGDDHCRQGDGNGERGRYRLRGTAEIYLCLKCFKDRPKDPALLRKQMELLIE